MAQEIGIFYDKSLLPLLDKEEKELFERSLGKRITETELSEALLWLGKLLYQYRNQKVYILIDEYDTPFNFALTLIEYYLENTVTKI